MRLSSPRSLTYRLVQLLLDSAIAFLACAIAFLLRFEGSIEPAYQSLALTLCVVAIPGRLLCHWLFGLYQQIWRMFSFRDSIYLLFSVSFYSLLLLTSTRLVIPQWSPGFMGLPLGVAVIDWGFCLMGMVMARYLRRRTSQKQLLRRRGKQPSEKRVLLVGAGESGAMVAREVRENAQMSWEIVGFVDDDQTKLHRTVEGFKVLGTVGQTLAIAQQYQVDEVLISMPSAGSEKVQQILDLMRGSGFKLKILPAQEEILLNRQLAPQARDIQIQDILGRAEIQLDFSDTFNGEFPSAREQVQGKVVLVTGAGGTIGSEICRQIAKLEPRLLVLLGRGEYSIFKIQQEFKRNFSEIPIATAIADIRDSQRMDRVFYQYRPELVFHAAAHKHVPLMEENPTEAIANNSLASAQLAQLAVKYGVKTFVMISTDKAVDSSNFMGLSKRLAELLVTGLAKEHQTRFLAVRFGNVLGSRGSVVPIFKAQIQRGGPVTVTDRRMTRYFMTTPEASQLVIQSLAVGQSGQILILDMGEPIKIYNLATQMIRLAGFVPEVDIPISFTGLRPGEKLHEALVNTKEKITKTAHPQIMAIATNVIPSATEWEQVITHLHQDLGENPPKVELWQRLKGYKDELEAHGVAVISGGGEESDNG